jgi:hypothetical protein
VKVAFFFENWQSGGEDFDEQPIVRHTGVPAFYEKSLSVSIRIQFSLMGVVMIM